MSRKSREVTITAATSTTAAMSAQGGTDKARMHLTPAEFGQQLNLLAQEAKDLVKIARRVGALRSGQSLKLSNGETFGAKELNALTSRYTRTLRQLKKNYSARGTRKPRSNVTKAGALRKKGDGFAKGSFLRPELLAFIQNANFGGVLGPAGGQSVREVLQQLLQAGLLSRSLLTVIFTIYEFANGLRFEQDGKKFFAAGPDMNKYLGPYLSQLEAADRARSDADMVDKKGNAKMRFDRNRFVYNRLQSIVQPGLFRKEELDQARLDYIENPQVKQALQDAQTALSATLKAWNP
jgi:hypothetical protein